MRNFTLSVISLLITTISGPIAAQSFANFSEISIALKSDSTSKSVLMSNMLQNKAGDMSPIIGSASWIDNGKRLECRSLIAFDYGILPKMISPDMITKAQLILMPLFLKDQADENETQASKITVRRVLQPWQDSTANWSNQPLTYIPDEVISRIPKKKKDQALKINVTEIVKNMFRFGNNGFLICYSDSMTASASSSNWFASAKYENENVRPLLLITYNASFRPEYDQKLPALPLTARDKDELMQMYMRPEPVVVSPPVTTEPIKQKENN